MPRTLATVRYTFGLQGTSSNNRADSNEPAFLRRLRAKHGGGDSARHERPLARPRKQVKDGEDDQPTYVVEGSQDTLSKAEYEALMGTANDEKQDENEPASSRQTLELTSRLEAAMKSPKMLCQRSRKLRRLEALTKGDLQRLLGRMVMMTENRMSKRKASTYWEEAQSEERKESQAIIQ